jgi:predicted nucleotidyltransferase component of viral defense system
VIPSEEILESARQQGLNANVVEKDYVLGWLLMEIARHPLLGQWVFKGGTCLKKCFFETYRFSEDLDFTVPQGIVYETQAYKAALVECTEAISGAIGIEFPLSDIEIKESHDKADHLTFLGKVSYRGPLMNQTKTLPRIKLDLTRHEVLAETPEKRPIRHFYSDAPDPPVEILCYTVNEILAEKTRALFERQGRARDLYDVVNIYRNHREEIDVDRAQAVLQRKFQFKGLVLPALAEFIASIDLDSLKNNWDQQLKHQLPVLPPLASYVEELRESALIWIEAGKVAAPLTRMSVERDEVVEPRAAFPQIPQRSRSSAFGGVRAFTSLGGAIEKIRYAARNRLCVEIRYGGVQRLAEPYSLRVKRTGNQLLYVHELLRGGAPSGMTKAYKVAEIEAARITETPFRPRFAVEL